MKFSKIKIAKNENQKNRNAKFKKSHRKISKFGNQKEPSLIERLQNADDFARWPDFGQGSRVQTNLSGNSTRCLQPPCPR
jgi:hypothetical protein